MPRPPTGAHLAPASPPPLPLLSPVQPSSGRCGLQRAPQAREQPLGVNHLPGHSVSRPPSRRRPVETLPHVPAKPSAHLPASGASCSKAPLVPPSRPGRLAAPSCLAAERRRWVQAAARLLISAVPGFSARKPAGKGGAAGKAPGSRERVGGAAPAVTAFAQPWPQSAPREALSTLLSKHCGLPTPPFRKGMHSAESLSLQNLRVPEPTTSEGEALHAHRGTLSATTATATTATAQVADYKRVFSIHS